MKQRSKYLVLTADYLIPLVIILFAASAWFIGFQTALFRIDQLTCFQDYEPCQNDSILAELDKEKGENLLSFRSEALETRLLSGDYTVRAVEFTKSFPRTLKVNLLSTYPVVALSLDQTPPQWVVFDSELRVIGVRKEDPNVPTVIVDTIPSFQLGGRVGDRAIEDSLTLALVISKELSSVRAIRLSGDYTVTLELDHGLTALMTTQKDRHAQLKTLESLLLDDSLTKLYHLFDVRYTQPVLK